jgi:hypothetical protein
VAEELRDGRSVNLGVAALYGWKQLDPALEFSEAKEMMALR